MTDTARDRERWAERYAADSGESRKPSSWVVAAVARIPSRATVIDLAGGSGRHAIPMAHAGHDVIVIDFVELAVRYAVSHHERIHGVVADIWSLPLRDAQAGAVVCTNFLERKFFPSLEALLKPGGVLIYETYTLEHRALVDAGRARAPRSPDYLLAPGELRELIAPLEILDAREGYVHDDAGERYCASVVARKA